MDATDAVAQALAAASVTAVELSGVTSAVRCQDGACRYRSDDRAIASSSACSARMVGQDHVDARDPGAAAAERRDDPRAWRAGGARQSGCRLHAADARRIGQSAADRMGLRCQRCAAAIAGACRCSTGGAARGAMGTGHGRATRSRAATVGRNFRAASGNGCCWRRPCLAARACCCSMNR